MSEKENKLDLIYAVYCPRLKRPLDVRECEVCKYLIRYVFGTELFCSYGEEEGEE